MFEPAARIPRARCSTENDLGDEAARSSCAAPCPPTAAAAPSSTISRWASQLAREIGAALVEVHGQADDRGLVRRRHASRAARRVRRACSAGRRGRRAHAALAAAREQARWLKRARERGVGARSTISRHAARELRQLAPRAGEETDARRRARAADERRTPRRGRVGGGRSRVGRRRRRDQARAARCAACRGCRRRARDARPGRGDGARSRACAVQEARRELERCSRGSKASRASSKRSRSGCLRCAPPRANTMSPSTRSTG